MNKYMIEFETLEEASEVFASVNEALALMQQERDDALINAIILQNELDKYTKLLEQQREINANLITQMNEKNQIRQRLTDRIKQLEQ